MNADNYQMNEERDYPESRQNYHNDGEEQNNDSPRKRRTNRKPRAGSQPRQNSQQQNNTGGGQINLSNQNSKRKKSKTKKKKQLGKSKGDQANADQVANNPNENDGYGEATNDNINPGQVNAHPLQRKPTRKENKQIFKARYQAMVEESDLKELDRLKEQQEVVVQLRDKYISDYKDKDIDFRRDFENAPHLIEGRGKCCCLISNRRAVKIIIFIDCLSIITGVFAIRAIAALFAFLDYKKLPMYCKIRFATLYVTLAAILALYTFFAYQIAFSYSISEEDMVWYLSTTVPISAYLILDLHYSYVVYERVRDDKTAEDKLMVNQTHMDNSIITNNRTANNLMGVDHSATDFSNLMNYTQSPDPPVKSKRKSKKDRQQEEQKQQYQEKYRQRQNEYDNQNDEGHYDPYKNIDHDLNDRNDGQTALENYANLALNNQGNDDSINDREDDPNKDQTDQKFDGAKKKKTKKRTKAKDNNDSDQEQHYDENQEQRKPDQAQHDYAFDEIVTPSPNVMQNAPKLANDNFDDQADNINKIDDADGQNKRQDDNGRENDEDYSENNNNNLKRLEKELKEVPPELLDPYLMATEAQKQQEEAAQQQLSNNNESLNDRNQDQNKLNENNVSDPYANI